MQKRNLNLDVIRSVAVLSVLCVHFFLFTNFYNIPLTGPTMYIATLLRTSFMVCVPLFLLLSGYLLNQKTLSVSYFKGISKTLIIYLLSCIPILLFRIFYQKEVFTIVSMVQSIFSFELYSWYIEMYIGLYLLIPFINSMYNHLKDKKEKTCFIAVMLSLTVLPTLGNALGLNIFPDYWTTIYPLTYYFIGAYIHEFKDDIQLSALVLFFIFIGFIVIGGTYCFFSRHNAFFVDGSWSDWGGVINTCTASTLFLFLLKCDFSRLPSVLAKLIQIISLVSLPLYLVSWIFDTLVYGVLNSIVLDYKTKILCLPLTVFCSFIGSFTVAYFIQTVYTFFKKRSARS